MADPNYSPPPPPPCHGSTTRLATPPPPPSPPHYSSLHSSPPPPPPYVSPVYHNFGFLPPLPPFVPLSTPPPPPPSPLISKVPLSSPSPSYAPPCPLPPAAVVPPPPPPPLTPTPPALPPSHTPYKPPNLYSFSVPPSSQNSSLSSSSSSSYSHRTAYVTGFVSLGGLFFLAFLAVGLFCLRKKKRKSSVAYGDQGGSHAQEQGDVRTFHGVAAASQSVAVKIDKADPKFEPKSYDQAQEDDPNKNPSNGKPNFHHGRIRHGTRVSNNGSIVATVGAVSTSEFAKSIEP